MIRSDETLTLLLDSIRRFVRERLAGYKVPKRVLAVPKMFRAPNGKADYKAAAAWAAEQVASA